jgi:putative DNA primase/helicase
VSSSGVRGRGDLHDRVREVIAANVAPAYEAVLGSALVKEGGSKEPVARCPFHHDAHPSLRVNLGKGTWYCDPCSKGGDLFGLAQQQWGASFPEAVGRLAYLLGIVSTNGGATAGGSQASAKPKPRLVRTIKYEIRDLIGTVVAIHHRQEFEDGKKSMPWEPVGTKPAMLPLYGIERTAALPDSAPILVVEGEKCVDSLNDRGVLAVGTVTGAAHIPCDASLKPLVRLKTLLWADSDDPGRKHMSRLGARLLALGAKEICEIIWAEAPEHGDAADFDGQLADMIESATPFIVHERPEVLVKGGDVDSLADFAQRSLYKRHREFAIYERNSRLVRVHAFGADHKPKDSRVKRPIGATVMHSVTVPVLRDVLTRAIDWGKIDRRARARVPIDCPKHVAEVLISRGGDGALRELVGVTYAPCLRPDGSVVSDPGYDEATGLLVLADSAFSLIPDRPSSEQIAGACAALRKPFEKFPFISEDDKAVVFSAILSGIQRRLLPTAPGHAIDAPKQSSGKTLLIDCVARIVTGLNATSITVGYDRAELEKRLISVLLAGDLVLNLDNIDGPLKSDFLASLLTSETIDARIMGGNDMAKLPTNLLFMLNGNNLTFSGDLPSRVISGRVDPGVEFPEKRTFEISNLRDYVLEHRAELVTAALTILKGYFVAGLPSLGLDAFGRFERWNSEIRAALVWAGLGDPCRTRDRIVSNDPERDQCLAVFSSWHAQFGDRVTTVREGIQAAHSNEALRFALLDVAADRQNTGTVNAQRLGIWLASHVDRIVGPFRLIKEPRLAPTGSQVWSVKKQRDGVEL